MTKEQLYKVLEHTNHSKEKRKSMAFLVIENPTLFLPLLNLAFKDNSQLSSKACWVIEFTTKENLAAIFPYLDLFTLNIGQLKRDSSVRPVAKVCEYLMTSYFKKADKNTLYHVKEDHLKLITSSCFDWLIGDHKVAAQAYSMTCLFLLGKKFDWIHSELKMVLEQNYNAGSAAYKARARITLEQVKKNTRKSDKFSK